MAIKSVTTTTTSTPPATPLTDDDMLEILSMFNASTKLTISRHCMAARQAAGEDLRVQHIAETSKAMLTRHINLATRMLNLIYQSDKEIEALNEKIKS